MDIDAFIAEPFSPLSLLATLMMPMIFISISDDLLRLATLYAIISAFATAISFIAQPYFQLDS